MLEPHVDYRLMDHLTICRDRQLAHLYHKIIATNEKVIYQGLILALTKNTFLPSMPSKLGKTQYFGAFSCIFQTSVTFFWLTLHIIPVCPFET